MKKVYLVTAGVLLVLVIAFFGVKFLGTPKPNAEHVLQFIREHPEKASLTIIHNDKAVVDYNSKRMMPLASVVKIMVAVEYAKQAAAGSIRPDELIKLEELERYYLPKLDGGAQPEWVKSVKERKVVKGDSVPMEEVVKGMIQPSSNANTEYLMERLGLDKINGNILELGLTRHEPIYPFYSSLLIPYELMQKYPDLPQKEKVIKAKEELRKMPAEQFRTLAMTIHEKLKNDVDGSYKKAAGIASWYDKEFDRMNSDRLIASTTGDYATLLMKINSRKFFPPEVQKHLEKVMETPMESPGNQTLYEHLGFKGGSTSYIINTTIYAADKEGNRTEMALFTNDLKPRELENLQANMNEFMKKIINDPAFRAKVNEQLF